jgi:ribosomal-protein-alanine N-acetyltransferase
LVASCNSEEPYSASAGEQKASRTRVGSFGANPLDKGETEVLFALLPDFWRGGMAGDMAQALTSYLFESTSVDGSEAFIVPGHEASIRVAEKLGYRNVVLAAVKVR